MQRWLLLTSDLSVTEWDAGVLEKAKGTHPAVHNMLNLLAHHLLSHYCLHTSMASSNSSCCWETVTGCAKQCCFINAQYNNPCQSGVSSSVVSEETGLLPARQECSVHTPNVSPQSAVRVKHEFCSSFLEKKRKQNKRQKTKVCVQCTPVVYPPLRHHASPTKEDVPHLCLRTECCEWVSLLPPIPRERLLYEYRSMGFFCSLLPAVWPQLDVLTQMLLNLPVSETCPTWNISDLPVNHL